MVSIEYGREHEQTLLLLHGGGLSWWNLREVAEILKSKYHVILPILDGHAGSDREFTSIEANAAEIIEFIDRTLGGQVTLIGGVSLGGQILAEILAQRSSICRYAVIESALTAPMWLAPLFIKPMMDLSYGLICREWFARLQFRSLHLKKELFSEYYRDTCRITRESMTAFLLANVRYRARPELAQSQARTVILAGQKEPAVMIRSAHKLKRIMPDSTLNILPGLHHGEFSVSRAAEYAGTIIDLMENSSGTPN